MTRFICQYCKKIFPDHEGLKQHYLTAHQPKMQEKARGYKKSEEWVAGTLAWASSVTLDE